MPPSKGYISIFKGRGLYLALPVILVVVFLSFKYRQSVFDAYNSFFKPPETFSGLPEATKLGVEKIFGSDLWTSLQKYGQLPIVPRLPGRASPFVASPGGSNTPAGRDSTRVSQLITIASGLSSYYEDINRYPAAESLEIGSESARCLGPSGWVEEEACETLLVKYLDHSPRDPGGNQHLYSSDGSSYTLKINLETAPDIEYTVSSADN